VVFIDDWNKNFQALWIWNVHQYDAYEKETLPDYIILWAAQKCLPLLLGLLFHSQQAANNFQKLPNRSFSCRRTATFSTTSLELLSKSHCVARSQQQRAPAGFEKGVCNYIVIFLWPQHRNSSCHSNLSLRAVVVIGYRGRHPQCVSQSSLKQLQLAVFS